MHENIVALAMKERLMSQPINELIGIGGCQDILQVIRATQFCFTSMNRDQVEVVVAQDHRDPFPIFIKPAQGFEVLWAAINKIPYGPQPISFFIKPHLFQQALKGFKASLNVTDGIGCHGLRIPRLLVSPQLCQCNELLYSEYLGAITWIDTQRAQLVVIKNAFEIISQGFSPL